ncbi:radical SAM protein [Salisediminibacterium beveridgei]|uniref:Radical SAM core domain-containing protein n=1 Tax=Salisediminibacterium beveridgei TaxID=632773 RepID=A0A1D7QRU7_9BACI|nr:radical SAM protein [Salisediminibacterium beveridgei]AOM81734.1 hypothetical protein BBEV_0340 [Salisediminibacterium beveridgei]
MMNMTNDCQDVKNPVFQAYLKRYEEIQKQTDEAIASLGIAFGGRSDEVNLTFDESEGVVSRNQNKSHYVNWISPACIACQTGEKSHTSFVSFKCHKSCYFCFNENQENFAEFQVRNNHPVLELERLLKQGKTFEHIALTGGEPLLHPKESVAFFEFIRDNTPKTYTRLYTAGDLLNNMLLKALGDAGLDEVRFSVKQDETSKQHEQLFERMRLSKSYIPRVVVEMPVIPGTLSEMKALLLKLDAIGIDGINLLEFCFPIQNPAPFIERGFKLKYPPFETYYNYWYAGGLAIDESQDLCRELLSFAVKEDLSLGVHYCSLENKHTGQLYQQNSTINDDQVRTFSQRDYFLKSAKAFGEDVNKVKHYLDERELTGYELHPDHQYIEFSVSYLEQIQKELNVEIGIASLVTEQDATGNVFREVGILPI